VGHGYGHRNGNFLSNFSERTRRQLGYGNPDREKMAVCRPIIPTCSAMREEMKKK